jgi:tetratricopeptide (TPR) repeat protein
VSRDAARGLVVHAFTRYGEGGVRGWPDLARIGRRFAADFDADPPFFGADLKRALSRPGLRQGPLRLPEATARDLAAALKKDPRGPWALALDGLRLYLSRRLEDAESRFAALCAENPKWPWAWILLAEARLYLGPARRALPDLARARELRPSWAWPLILEGRALFSAQDESCLASLGAASRLAPDMALARAWNGHALATLGRIEEGLAELSRAAVLDPAYARPAAWRGMHLVRSGRRDEGLASLERSLRLDPHYPPAHLARAEARLATGDGAGAAAALKALAECCVRAQWRANAASVHYLKGERDLARTRRLCAAAAAAAPGSPWPRLWLGQTLLAEGEFAASAKALTGALDLGLPGDWKAWGRAWRGRALARLGRGEDAALDLDAALKFAPRLAWAQAWRAELFLLAGRAEDARRCATAATKADPDLADAWAALSAAREVLGDQAGALDACAQASSLQPLWSWAKRRRLALASGVAPGADARREAAGV